MHTLLVISAIGNLVSSNISAIGDKPATCHIYYQQLMYESSRQIRKVIWSVRIGGDAESYV